MHCLSATHVNPNWDMFTVRQFECHGTEKQRSFSSYFNYQYFTKVCNITLKIVLWSILKIFLNFYGPQTIFFWAPAFKWGLVFAGIADLARPADKLSPSQSTALAATGLIWARYSLVIIPKNWLLFSVNIGLGITGINQLCRIAYYRYTLEKSKESSEIQASVEHKANWGHGGLE